MKKTLVLLAALFLPACLMATAGKSSANITILSVTNLSGVQATDHITVTSTSTLKNTYITANGKRLRNGYEWKTGANTSATAASLAVALNYITGIEASASANVVYATVTAVGTAGNSYTLTSYGSGLTVSTSPFSGGVNAGYVTIDGIKLVFGVDIATAASTSGTATNLVTAIQANTFLDSLMDVSATGAVVYATATQVGDNAYPLVGYPSNKVLASGPAFVSGGNPSGNVAFYKTIVADSFYGDGSNMTGIGTGNGTITGVTAGIGLTGGGTSGSVTLNVSTAPHATSADTATYATTAGSLSAAGVSAIISTQTSVVINVNGATTTVTANGTTNNVVTGMSFDANGSRNQLAWKDFSMWTNADFILGSTNAWYTTTSTSPYYGRATFSPTVSTTTNAVYLDFFTPPDFDTTTVPTAYWSAQEMGVDPSSTAWIVSSSSMTTGVSTRQALTYYYPIAFGIPGVSPGADGTTTQSSAITLTGWNTYMAPSTHYVICIQRQGDSATLDPSTVGSAFGKFVLVYGRRQHL